jgi:hypothetical protein
MDFSSIVPGGRLSSKYGLRKAPLPGASTYHGGVDIAAPKGTPIYAACGGIVSRAGIARGYGQAVFVTGADGISYEYGHLDTIGVSSGSIIEAGQRIGTVGSTGNSTGPHLHLATKVDGKSVNPLDVLGRDALKEGGRILKETAKNALKTGFKALDTAVPGAGSAIKGVSDALGVTGNCSLICQFEKWINKSQFFKRTAVVILALIIIFAAFYLIGSGTTQRVISQIGKA